MYWQKIQGVQVDTGGEKKILVSLGKCQSMIDTKKCTVPITAWCIPKKFEW